MPVTISGPPAPTTPTDPNAGPPAPGATTVATSAPDASGAPATSPSSPSSPNAAPTATPNAAPNLPPATDAEKIEAVVSASAEAKRTEAAYLALEGPFRDAQQARNSARAVLEAAIAALEGK